MTIKRVLTTAILVLSLELGFAESALTESDQKRLIDAGKFDCVPVENFGLNGISLWAPEETIQARLGKPLTVSRGDGEDDGGYYEITSYEYPGLTVEAVRQHVDRIVATSPSVAMPSGIRIGDSHKDVEEKFGRRPRSLSADPSEIHLVTCPVEGVWVQEDYVTLLFDRKGILISIRYEANRP